MIRLAGCALAVWAAASAATAAPNLVRNPSFEEAGQHVAPVEWTTSGDSRRWIRP